MEGAAATDAAPSRTRSRAFWPARRMSGRAPFCAARRDGDEGHAARVHDQRSRGERELAFRPAWLSQMPLAAAAAEFATLPPRAMRVRTRSSRTCPSPHAIERPRGRVAGRVDAPHFMAPHTALPHSVTLLGSSSSSTTTTSSSSSSTATYKFPKQDTDTLSDAAAKAANGNDEAALATIKTAISSSNSDDSATSDVQSDENGYPLEKQPETPSLEDTQVNEDVSPSEGKIIDPETSDGTDTERIKCSEDDDDVSC